MLWGCHILTVLCYQRKNVSDVDCKRNTTQHNFLCMHVGISMNVSIYACRCNGNVSIYACIGISMNVSIYMHVGISMNVSIYVSRGVRHDFKSRQWLFKSFQFFKSNTTNLKSVSKSNHKSRPCS